MFGGALVACIAHPYGQAIDDQASVTQCEVLSDLSKLHFEPSQASDSQTCLSSDRVM